MELLQGTGQAEYYKHQKQLELNIIKNRITSPCC